MGDIYIINLAASQIYIISPGEDVWFRQPSRHHLEITQNGIM